MKRPKHRVVQKSVQGSPTRMPRLAGFKVWTLNHYTKLTTNRAHSSREEMDICYVQLMGSSCTTLTRCYSRLEISILFCPTLCSLTGYNTALSLCKRLPIMVALKGGEKGKRGERDATPQRETVIRMREIRFTECEDANKDVILIWLQRMSFLSLNWLLYIALIYVIRSLLCFNI